MKKNFKNLIFDNLKTIFFALIIALIIRSLLIQPFYIPSSSMEPNLLIGDRLFVSKYTYGYSRHSFPFSPPIGQKRFFNKNPKTYYTQADLVKGFGKSNPRTNKVLRDLVEDGKVVRTKVSNKYFYQKK